MNQELRNKFRVTYSLLVKSVSALTLTRSIGAAAVLETAYGSTLAHTVISHQKGTQTADTPPIIKSAAHKSEQQWCRVTGEPKLTRKILRRFGSFAVGHLLQTRRIRCRHGVGARPVYEVGAVAKSGESRQCLLSELSTFIIPSLNSIFLVSASLPSHQARRDRRGADTRN